MTYFVTALGAATVFLFKSYNKRVLAVMMGFAAGVMIAASFWSLLSPAIELLKSQGKNIFIVVAIGFMCGGMFVNGSDMLLNVLSRDRLKNDPSVKRSILLTFAVTVHNIPEGLSIGVAFGAISLGIEGAGVASALMLAVGIALQNFPEGMCVSMPLKNEGYSRKKAFFIGQASGIVEPIAGVLGVIAALTVRQLLPFALSFSAGAMIAVVCSELVPEAFKEMKILPSIGVIFGFTIMMVLDIALG